MDDVLDLVEPGDLWLVDSHSCTLDIMASIEDAGGFLLIRQHGTLEGCPVGEPRRMGRTENGEVHEQELQMTGRSAGRVVRRLTLVLEMPVRLRRSGLVRERKSVLVRLLIRDKRVEAISKRRGHWNRLQTGPPACGRRELFCRGHCS
jgi:hypothetical protein